MHRIRELREEKGLTQVRLAVAADMNPATLNRIEMGKANPNLKTLERLADALDITVSRLLEDDSPKAQASLWPEEEPERRNPEPGEAERRWRNPDATEASRIAEEINLPPSLDSLNIVDIMRDVVDADRRRNEQQITRHRESGESQTTYSSVVREFEHRMEDQLGGAFGGFMYSGLRNSVLRILDLEEENARLKKEVETAQERAANV